jgi:hypothetical protein
MKKAHKKERRFANKKNPAKSDADKTTPATSTSEGLSESMIDETLTESFPTSDPPAWTTGRDHTQALETEDDELNQLSDQDLNEKAGKLNIAGRNGMKREQLILAIRGQLSGNEV